MRGAHNFKSRFSGTEYLIFQHYFPFVIMMTSVVIIDVVRVVYDGMYPVVFAVTALLFVFGYMYVVMLKVHQYALVTILFMMVLIKAFMMLTGIVGGFYQEESVGTSDWALFHIPKSLEYLQTGNVIESMVSRDAIYNGRLTHLIIMSISLYLSYLGFDGTSSANIAIASDAFSFLICSVVIVIFYRASYLYSGSIQFARRSAFFLALNPFFLAVTGNPQKEILLYLSVGLFLLYLLSDSGGIVYLFLSFVIMIFERVYLIPLLLIILFFVKGGHWRFVFLFLGAFAVEMFIGVDHALSMHQTHVESLVNVDGSYLPGHGVVSNIIRGGFGPFFLRPFIGEVTSYTALGVSKYVLYLFFSYFFVKSIFNTDGALKAIFIIYIYLIILLPFHGTLKIFLLTSFGGIFLDRISFVKYMPDIPRGPIVRFINKILVKDKQTAPIFEGKY